MLTSPDGTEPYMVCVEDESGMHYVDRTPDVRTHSDLFQFLHDAALSPEATVQLIQATMRERYS